MRSFSGITRIALLVNPNNPGLMQDNIELSKAAAQRLGLELVVVKAGSESEIENAVGDSRGTAGQSPEYRQRRLP